MLNGGHGSDQLWGGPNNDGFVFNKGSGLDVINDFGQGNKAVGSTAREHDLSICTITASQTGRG